MKPLLITSGDPQGIGPEVMVRALVQDPPNRPVIFMGDGPSLRRAVEMWGPLPPNVLLEDTTSPGGELAEVAAIRQAATRCLSGAAVAMVTGPINKEKLALAGFKHTGHTDFLGSICGVKDPVMAFVGEQLNVSLVTVHCPLAEVPNRITKAAIIHVLRTTYESFSRFGNTPTPRLLVCGLNPHAGDGGVLGREEIECIGPAVLDCAVNGVVGPISAEAAFTRAMKGTDDVVVAMYHDQGLAPLKAVEFGRCVNWTLGLPIIRTSVDHGTAYDLAWTGRADPGSAVAAIRWALHCAERG